MPWWSYLLLGLGAWALTRPRADQGTLITAPAQGAQTQNATWFYNGQTVVVPSGTSYFSDAALTRAQGKLVGEGQMLIKGIDTVHDSLGVGWSTADSGAPMFVRATDVRMLS